MTIIDEMKDMAKYDKLKFVEFLEFIGRVAAQLDSMDDNNRLYPKLEVVMKKVLATINERVRYPEVSNEAISESDSEPYKH